MSFMDSRKKSNTLDVDKQSLHIPELVTEQSPADQLPFPDSLTLSSGVKQNPAVTEPVTSPLQTSGPISSPDQTQSLVLPPAVTRQLAQTGALMTTERQTEKTAARQPVIIRGSGTKSTGMLPPKVKRNRAVVHASVASILVFMVIGALLLIVPASRAQNGFGLFQPNTNSVNTKNNNYSLITQQAATATVVMTDGRDVGANTNNPASASYNPFLPVEPASVATSGDASSLNRFFYGQCTYWANYRYGQLTGHYVSWLGNAYQWAAGASANGWVVSATPHVASIIVLQPGVEGAGAYGHVAVVESINSDGSVHTSDWNWAGSGASTTYVDFRNGPGVSYVWYPGK